MVTGGAGFVGSSLVAELLSLGCKTIAIDDLSGGKQENLDLGHPDLIFHQAKVGNPDFQATLEKLVSASDFVFHLASPIGVEKAHRERFDIASSILASGMAVVAACQKFQVPMLLTSSSEVYGTGSPRPISEENPVSLDVAPRWGYAAAKFALEHLVTGLWREKQIPGFVVRPFNIAGPRQNPDTGLAVVAFLRAAINGQPMIVHGDGRQMRAFMHVKDAVSGLLAIASCPDLCGRPVNLGSPIGISIMELAQQVASLIGPSARIEQRPVEDLFGADFVATTNRVPDVSLICRYTSWQPKLGLDVILTDSVAEMKNAGGRS